MELAALETLLRKPVRSVSNQPIKPVDAFTGVGEIALLELTALEAFL